MTRQSRLRAKWDAPRVNAPSGEWMRISILAKMESGDIFDIQSIRFYNYSKGDAAYIDDVLIAPLE